MTVMEITKSKARQREIISYIANNDVELDELLKLQKELNQLMNENTIEKQKNLLDQNVRSHREKEKMGGNYNS